MTMNTTILGVEVDRITEEDIQSQSNTTHLPSQANSERVTGSYSVNQSLNDIKVATSQST